jgi:hypothetical protein
MLSSLIGKIRQPQLPHPPQPLKLRRIDQPRDQPTLSRPRLDPYYVMNRIAVVSQIPQNSRVGKKQTKYSHSPLYDKVQVTQFYSNFWMI